MSAESAPTPNEHIIPQGLLEDSIKITNEPPTGMMANLHAALYNFDQVRKQSLVSGQSQGLLTKPQGHYQCVHLMQRVEVKYQCVA